MAEEQADGQAGGQRREKRSSQRRKWRWPWLGFEKGKEKSSVKWRKASKTSHGQQGNGRWTAGALAALNLVLGIWCVSGRDSGSKTLFHVPL